MNGERTAAIPASVISALESNLEQLAEVTVAKVLRDLESYRAVEPAALETSVRRNLGIAVRALRASKAPAAAELGEAEETTRERFAADLPVEEIIRAFRISIGLIQEQFVETCVDQDVSAAATLAGSRVLWVLGDSFTTRVITTYHALDFDNALQDAHRRTTQVRAILTGHGGTPDAAGELARYRVDPAASYAAIRCLTNPETVEKTRRAIEQSGGVPTRPALVAVDDGECIGIVARRPSIHEAQVIGLGPFVPLREMPTSFQIASRACDVARQLRRRGVFGLEDLTWRLAASDHPEVTEFLQRRYLDPLHREGEFGDVLEETLRVYLDHGMSVTETARALVTHPNTLRYRLRRIGELTGQSLESIDTLVELRWALEICAPS
jgi:putative transposase